MSDPFDDRRPHVPRGGGRGHDSPVGTIHLSFRSGSRSGGASAAAAFAYITRTDEYAEQDLDEAIYTESDHMPAWAEDAPENYWDAADLFERANGRLYVSADFALPLDLEEDEQIELARSFAHDLTDEEELPYTLAIHAGRDEDGAEHNPHAHLLISERMNDGVARDREQWFRRANRNDPSRGGAPKSRACHGRPWVEHARERWADLVNRTLEARGRPERVDHRSYARQGIDREPSRHVGPSAAHLLVKGQPHDRLVDAAAVETDRAHLQSLDSAIATLERERADLVRESRTPASQGSGTRSAESTPSRDDDWSPGR